MNQQLNFKGFYEISDEEAITIDGGASVSSDVLDIIRDALFSITGVVKAAHPEYSSYFEKRFNVFSIFVDSLKSFNERVAAL